MILDKLHASYSRQARVALIAFRPLHLKCKDVSYKMVHTQFDNGKTKYEQYLTVFLEVLELKSKSNKTRMSNLVL